MPFVQLHGADDDSKESGHDGVVVVPADGLFHRVLLHPILCGQLPGLRALLLGVLKLVRQVHSPDVLIPPSVNL